MATQTDYTVTAGQTTYTLRPDNVLEAVQPGRPDGYVDLDTVSTDDWEPGELAQALREAALEEDDSFARILAENVADADWETPEYTVYHGGQLRGLGRWSGPHATRQEAESEAARCKATVGGDPIIRME